MVKNEKYPKEGMLNIFSCDVEDWYQSSYNFDAEISDRVYSNVSRCIELLDETNTKGTFFIQGLVAEQRPEVVKLIDQAGHEIGSHAYSHRPINKMNAAQFREEVRKTNGLLEDLSGKKVTGFRAPDFSIFNGMHFVWDILEEHGIEYDSSLFPLQMRRYGNPGCPLEIFKIKGQQIIELPISMYRLGQFKIPVAGGGYIRLLPLFFLKKALASINQAKLPFVMYCHPYEFDSNEWRHIHQQIPITRRFHQGIGRRSMVLKIKEMMFENDFGTMSDFLSRQHHYVEEACL